MQLKPGALLSCLAVIGAADLMLTLWRAPRVVVALADEPAHAATGLLALSVFGVEFDVPVVGAVLAGSVLIDLDHVPDLLGSDVLQHGLPRPYTHSLATVVVLATAALLRRRRARKLMLVTALAIVVHFFRDVSEPGGPGVALLWPLSDHAYTVSYSWYAAALLVAATIALARRRGTSPRPRWLPQSEN